MTELEATPRVTSEQRESTAFEVAVTVDERTYDVFGADEHMLDLAMKLRGPRRRGRVFVAYTDWEVEWAPAEDGPRVALRAVVMLPSWRPPRLAPTLLLERWTRFRDALVLHERGHLEIGLAAARALAAELAAAPPQSGAMTDLARAVVAPYLELERRYDVDTQHGATQGAVLRPMG